MKRFTLVSLFAVAVAFLALPAAGAENWPQKPVQFVVPFTAGGTTDLVARSLQTPLEKELKTTVVVKNVDGAGGTIGAAAVAAAKPDGYTVGLLPVGPTTLQPHLRKLPYSRDSFIPVAKLTNNSIVLMVPKDSPYKSLGDLVEDARKNPGQIAYGSSGPGSLPHVAMEALALAVGAKFKHIPDKSGAAAQKSLLAGMTRVLPDALPYLERYDVNGLAVFRDERHPSFPDVPTVKESGFAVEIAGIWMGVFMPAGTPAEIVKAFEQALARAYKAEEVQKVLEANKYDAEYISGQQFEAFYHKEYEQNGEILKAAGLKKD